ncbi:Rho GTPase activation protein [Laetiporus sulphureus 93-53]|uniref:Rho GTPase activation protein n=1 Tax=Laetiporus sulphureus 93-53 TaxID=1314785 RepID=A0A165CFD1_9APHY|nr:Rho GTPase activation protein [Laetiporus sulphureus 93-53]KZT02708.1 Rho GTPase activation protein [Laetiporus sulphureus 93-53]
MSSISPTERSRKSGRRKSLVSEKKEFTVPVELYVSAKAASALRKPAVLYRRSQDRLDKPGEPSRLNVRSSAEGTARKVKEKSSWLSLGRNSLATGQWRVATCKLMEEDESPVLNVYLDGALYQSVYVYALNHTDIRPIHHSLFDCKDCLGIYCVAGQMWCASPIAEPTFLHFPDSGTMHLWLSLLRAHAVPEVYGRWLAPADGGLYRMWRQVELTCLEGRNLGAPRNIPASSSAIDDLTAPSLGDEHDGGTDALDMDVYCEIFVNGCLCGRTTVKRGIGAPDWQERFTFADLPPFENLEIVAWREKKLTKPTMLGAVLIVLVNFRRGEHVEGWFPVLHSTSSASMQAGELRLRIRVEEEIILPYSAYAGVLQTFSSRNSLDWMSDLESKLKLKHISKNIISIAIAKNVLVNDIMEIADREVDGTLSSHNTLFRGNTVLTKTMELFMSWYGAEFLEASVGPTIRRLCSEKVAIEVDPARSGKGTKSTEKNVELLVQWCQTFWDCIYNARELCPPEMRKLFQHIRSLVEQRYQVSDEVNKELPCQSVSAFCFLRFIVPAILHPHLFGIWPGMPEVRVQRSLTLVAKVIQNLANLNATVHKEGFMRGVKDFLLSSLKGMTVYIMIVSTPDPSQTDQPTGTSVEAHERAAIMNAIRQRGASSPILYREATPVLPHLLDLPKHLAVITAVVVRYSRSHGYTPSRTPSGDSHPFDEFCLKCLEVEEQALYRVSQLASRPRHHSSSQPSNSSPLATNIPLPPSPSSPAKVPHRNRNLTPFRSRVQRKNARPATAPDDSEFSHYAQPSSDASVPVSPISDQPGQCAHSQSVPQTSRSVDEIRTRPRSSHMPRAPFHHQLRSSSTDSALLSKSKSDQLSLSSSPTKDALSDGIDDVQRKRKSLFHGFLARR